VLYEVTDGREGALRRIGDHAMAAVGEPLKAHQIRRQRRLKEIAVPGRLVNFVVRE
jgi:hypothetical protein